MENKPGFISFVGIDQCTNLERAVEIQNKYYNKVEWGILLGGSLGTKARYPSIEKVEEIIDTLGAHNCTVHVCGRYAKELNQGVIPFSFLLNVAAVQVNMPTKKYDLDELRKLPMCVILQSRGEWPSDKHFNYLYDCSGGVGKVPKSVPELPDDAINYYGYAGGISPDNVTDWLKKVKGRGKFYLDMESGVRTDDWFDLDKVEAVLEKVYENVCN